jgi:hypothetical protein
MKWALTVHYESGSYWIAAVINTVCTAFFVSSMYLYLCETLRADNWRAYTRL